WQEVRGEALVTYLEASSDVGRTWTEPINFTDFDVIVESSDVVQDSTGKLYLVQLLKDPNAGMVLQESFWDGKNWIKEEREVINPEVAEGEHWLMQVSVTLDGSLGVLLSKEITDALSTSSDMIFTSRRLTDTSPVNPPATPASEPTQEGTPALTDGGEPTQTPEDAAPTPTPAPERPVSQPAIDATILGPIVGLVAAGFLVVLAFVVITKLANRNV
ncbi:MAG TPA: hypothetical protein PK530_04060, partial [Anaerolineales bacterium]|nr:hypothetical protein [Anaerolineales bacterium]